MNACTATRKRGGHAALLLMTFALALHSLPVTAYAELPVWYVDQANTSGVEDGTTWASAFRALQTAVDAVYSAGGG